MTKPKPTDNRANDPCVCNTQKTKHLTQTVPQVMNNVCTKCGQFNGGSNE